MCSDPEAESSFDSLNGAMLATIANLPKFLQVTGENILPFEQQKLGAAQAISPGYNQLLTDLYTQSAPKLAQTGADVERINRTGAAETDLAILRGSGGQLAKEGQELDKILNPEFYNTRAATADKLGQLLASIDLNNANPEAERLINQENERTGNANVSSNTNTVSNALSFGNELQKRRDSLGQALTVATQALQPMQGQFNPIQTALNRPSSNTGENRFAGTQNPGGEAMVAGNNILGQSVGLKQQQNDINANRRDTLDRVTEVMGSVSV